MKGLRVNAIMPWEVGLLLILVGMVLIFLGIRQGRKKDIDLNNLPFTKPTTKIIFGSSFILIGIIQLFPLMIS